MKKIITLFTICILFLTAGGEFAAGAGRSIVVLPFYDDSGYNGPWELRKEVPEMLGDMLMDEYFTIVPIDSVLKITEIQEEKNIFSKILEVFSNRKSRQRLLTDVEVVSIGRNFNADYAITGIIETFSYRRSGGGDVMIGGYKSYTTRVELSNVRVIRVADGTPMGTVKGDSEKNERGLGLELLGKPRKRDLEFYSLDSLDFGSRRFLSTLMGDATVDALNKIQREIRAIVTQMDSAWFEDKRFKVFSVDAGIVTINAGSTDGVSPGDRLRVFASESGILVGRINVTTVWSDHLSKAEILDGQDAIRVDDIIMPE